MKTRRKIIKQIYKESLEEQKKRKEEAAKSCSARYHGD